MKPLKNYFKEIELCLIADRFALKNGLHQLIALDKKGESGSDVFRQKFKHWLHRLEKSQLKVSNKKSNIPIISYNETLPVSQAINEIADLFNKNQVIIVASETGSGKTTQLAKMCIEQGRGIFGQIAHTQPRRLAAISVANRIAEELKSDIGQSIGYKIRFNDQSSESCFVKLMTDGLLLAEIQQDKLLLKYDCLIIDEAHERSLNIDFLLGYIKRILKKHPDLKVIITSATINTQKFSDFFYQAPVIEVSGKLWPVEIRYRSLIDESLPQPEQGDEVESFNQLLANAVTELCAEGAGDILVFLSGEKEIRDSHDFLKAYFKDQLLCIPLFARLSANEQKRIFHTTAQRRVILSTNIAETSITVPGIQYVIDAGKARISRYSIKNKIQSLPIENISQASAKQRSGRCGRVAAGIAIRLYSEQDFNTRDEFTEAEILRTNLAQVILQMLKLNLGNMQHFDFIDKPQLKNINDGYSLLVQLGAIKLDKKSPNYQLTPLGRNLSQLNIDPKLGRVLLESVKQHVLTEVMVIVAAMSCQDPREMPKEQRQLSQEKHKPFIERRSDFITLLNIWLGYHQQEKNLSQNQLRKYCYQNFLSFNRIREWKEIVSQLKQQLKELKIKTPRLGIPEQQAENEQAESKQKNTHMSTSYLAIHLSLLTGLAQYVAKRDENKTYQGCRNMMLRIHPASAVSKKSPAWILAAEIVETAQVFARKVAYIEPDWIEQQVPHLIKSHYYDPIWDNKQGKVLGKAKLSLFGLVINPAKTINFAQVDPELAHDVFIKSALLTGVYTNFQRKQPDFLQKNIDTIKELQQLEHKSRRHDIIEDDSVLLDFYQQNISPDICSRTSFENWYKKIKQKNAQALMISKEQLMRHDASHVSHNLYPDQIVSNQINLKLEYHFRPNHPLDGVTVNIPLALLNKLNEKTFSRLVPGIIREKVEYMFRALPKAMRKVLFPIADKITLFLQSDYYRNEQLSLYEAFYQFVEKQTRSDFDHNIITSLDFPLHLKMNYRLISTAKKNERQELDCLRDLSALQKKWGAKAEKLLREEASLQFDQTDEYSNNIEKTGLLKWDFDDLSEQVSIEKWGSKMMMYPALVDQQNSVAIRLFDQKEKAMLEMEQGLLRLYNFHCDAQIKTLLKLNNHHQPMMQLSLLMASFENSKDKKSQVARLNLPQQLSEQLIRQLLQPENLIYNQHDFLSNIKQNLALFDSALEQLLKLLINIMTLYKQLKLRIKKQKSLALIHLMQDIEQQLAQLFVANFIAQTDFNWLRRFPLYLQAIDKRLDNNFSAQSRQDAMLQKEINDKENEYFPYLKNIDWNSDCFKKRADILQYRWLLEELRLSFFAQELKTIQSVSSKKLGKSWLEIKQFCH